MLLEKMKEFEKQVEKRAYRQRFDPVTHEPILPTKKGLEDILRIYHTPKTDPIEIASSTELSSLEPYFIHFNQAWDVWNRDRPHAFWGDISDRDFRAKAPAIKEVAPNTVSDLHALDNLSLEGVTGKDVYRQPVIKNVIAPKTYKTPQSVLNSRAAFEENIKHKPLPRKAVENYLKADEQFNNLINKFKNGENIFDPKTMSIKTQVPKIKEVASPHPRSYFLDLDNLALESELGRPITGGETIKELAEAAKSPFRKHMDKHFNKYVAGVGAAMAGAGLYNYYKKNKEKTASMHSENPLINFELAKVACANYLGETYPPPRQRQNLN